MKPSARVQLRVSPGAARSEIVGRYGAAWKVRVAAPAEDGRANSAVVQLLSDRLDVPREDITIVSGHGARDKLVGITGIDAAELDARLDSASRRLATTGSVTPAEERV